MDDCHPALSGFPIVPLPEDAVPSPCHGFSGREAFMFGDIVVVNVRVELPLDGVCVQLGGDNQLHVKFLPPIEVRIPLTTEGAPREAHISCVWLKFKQLRKVGACLDSLWEKDSLLSLNIETLLDKLAPKAMEDIKMDFNKELDLGWWRPTEMKNNIELEVPKSPRRFHKNIVFKTFTRFKKGDNIAKILKEHDDNEVAFNAMPGDVTFICDICTLPLRPVRCYRCPDGHTLCYTCMMQCLKAAASTPILCPSYGCRYELTLSELKELAAGHLDVLNHIYTMKANESFTEFASKHLMHKCRWCSAEVFLANYVRECNITLCKKCGQCFCDGCIRDGGTGYSICDVTRYLEFKNAPADKRQTIIEFWDNKYLQRLKDAYEDQHMKVFEVQTCPRCLTPAHKFDGCNKIPCPRCKKPYCYVCREKLDEVDPYSHFHNGTCPIYG